MFRYLVSGNLCAIDCLGRALLLFLHFPIISFLYVLCFKNLLYNFYFLFEDFSKPLDIFHVQKLLRNCENRYCSGIHKQCKTLFRDHMVRLKIISLYIYKDLRLKTYDLRLKT